MRISDPAGCLADALAGFEPRAEQEALAAEVADALESRDHLVAEAGTGTGKSLAYLCRRSSRASASWWRPRRRRFRSSS
jgi:ATP-dependent DNA helicase DinG